MNGAAPVMVVLSGGQSLALALALLLPLVLAALALWTGRLRKKSSPAEPDWSIPALATQGNSPFHAWTPPIKVAVLLLCSFLIAGLTTLFWAGAALVVSAAAVAVSGIAWRRPLRRLAAMAGFLFLLVIVLPLTSAAKPGETILIAFGLDSLPFHLGGLILALTVLCKAASIGLLMEPMLATAPLAETLRGFTRLGLPPALIETTLLCHRYLFVVQEETARMQRAVRVRGFHPRTDRATLRTLGNCLGMLFIRSFERTERVHQAMLSRGYRGAMPTGPAATITRKDVLMGAGCLLLGIALFVLDRMAIVPWP